MDRSLLGAIICFSLVFSATGVFSYAGIHPSSQSLTWGPIQNGTVRDTATIKNILEITVIESSQAVLFIDTSLGCNTFYHSNSPILYQISSVDQSINTQRIRLVNSPANCTAQ